MERFCTANLETIARHYAGERVTVEWRVSAHWQGLATRTDAGAVILLNPHAQDLGFVFFHELGHIVRGHCTVTSTADPDADTAAILARLSPAERAILTPMIDERENEADTWAMVNLAAFERRFGAFLEAVK